MIIASVSAAVYAGSVVLTTEGWREASKLQNRLAKVERMSDKIWRIAHACHKRWILNGKYRPSLNEVMSWVSTIAYNDVVIDDAIHYCAMIDLESLGNPTLYLRHDSKGTRGLGCICHKTAKDFVKRRGIQIKAVGTALFNPHFNIYCMVKLFEERYSRAKDKAYKKYTNKMELALSFYNAGERGAIRMLKKGQVNAYYRKYLERKQEIKRLMR